MVIPMQDIDNFVKCRWCSVDGDTICVVICHSIANTAIAILLSISVKDIHNDNVLVRLSVIFKNMRMIIYHILVTGTFCIMNEAVQSR